ncbi:hypothetical protein COO60DRAFT_1624134 [Scenedesmus sp. NREL 46B-D3]|nr:hypothetical protein COO60DRAFT_1624134 [Scenedesmus sp. NREL 46B-D3]
MAPVMALSNCLLLWSHAPGHEDCFARSQELAGIMGAAGIPVGFFRAHVALKDRTLAEKMQRWQNVKLTARIMANPIATFAAAGLAFAAAECNMKNYLGREDTLNGIVGGAAVGAVLGLKTNSGANALKYGALFAGAMVVTDFLTKMADAISSFVAAQRNRTQHVATKTAWGVAAKQLAVERYTAACLRQRRAADLAAGWQRHQAAFLADSCRMLGEAAAAAAAGAEAAAGRLAWEAAGALLAGHLAGLQQAKQQERQWPRKMQPGHCCRGSRQCELRRAKQCKQQVSAELSWYAAMAVASCFGAAALVFQLPAHSAGLDFIRQGRAAQQEAAQHEGKKAQVQQYKQELAQQLARAKGAEEQAAAEAAAALQASIAAQRPMVAARQAGCLGKRQEQLQQHQQRQERLAERQARLPTAASAAAADAAAGAAAFQPVHGYTTAQVVADPRFRVVEALNSAGLLSGAVKGYVQQVVAAVQPATASRIDNFTTTQLQAAARRLD